ncbi:AMP-binding protein [Nocardia terpenica]|uniref:AMP-binding protein n=1 Tax=Nocardia terpenica TaxID=455432 RepID=UPI00142DD546|nr:AMP-binding protein [Nocardia terpenica]
MAGLSSGSLGGAMWEWARRNGDRVALWDDAGAVSYGALARRADALAVVLREVGIGRGDRVLMQLPNGWELVVGMLAVQRAGAAAIPALMGHRLHDLTRIAETAGVAAVFTVDAHQGHDHRGDAHRLAAGRPVFVAGEDVGAADIDLRRACDHRVEEADRVRADLDRHDPDVDEDAVILLSGGTTGRPKLVPHTHRDYRHAFRACAAASGVDAATVYLAALPVAHNFSLASPGILGVLDAGGTVVLGRSPSPEAAFAAIARHGVTMSALVPAVARRWAEHARSSAAASAAVASLRLLQLGGAVTPPDLAAEVEGALGVTVQQVYGMSEGPVCMTAPDDPPEFRYHTQGLPVTGDEIRLLDTAGREADAGTVGEVVTRGPSLVRGYLGAADDSAFTADGWYHTGDLARRRADGRIEIAGRIKDLVNRGGEKISVVEVETVLYGLPGIAAAAVVSLPHPDLGECIAAAVVPAAGTAVDLPRVRKFFADTGVAAHKTPDALFVVDDIPRTGMGKVDRPTLRDRLTAARSAPNDNAKDGVRACGTVGAEL